MMNIPNARRYFRVLLLSMLGMFALASQAHQFRQFDPIPTPQQQSKVLPQGAVASETLRPIPKQLVEPQLRALIKKWNSPAMKETLAAEFYDRSRLLDAVDGIVPRSAILRLQSIQGIQTLQQYSIPDENKRVSIISATARTQLEYNGSSGFIRLPGTNEFILKVTESMGSP